MADTFTAPPVEIAHGFTPLGHCDQGGRPDGMQLQYYRGYIYVGHLFSSGYARTALPVKDETLRTCMRGYPSPRAVARV